MTRCAHILNNGARCKRTAQTGSEFCWQHQSISRKLIKKKIMDKQNPPKLYFDLLPSELLNLLLLTFNSTELLAIVPKLEKLHGFNHVLMSRTLWRTIWKRDISSFVEPPDNIYGKYQEIFQDLYQSFHKYIKIEFLAENGYDQLLLPLLSDHYDRAMDYAAKGGHIELVKLMLEKGAREYDWALNGAAAGGNIEIVKLMLGKGAHDYKRALSNAAAGGHIDIVKLMLEKGADNYALAIRYAKTQEIVDLIESYENA